MGVVVKPLVGRDMPAAANEDGEGVKEASVRAWDRVVVWRASSKGRGCAEGQLAVDGRAGCGSSVGVRHTRRRQEQLPSESR